MVVRSNIEKILAKIEAHLAKNPPTRKLHHMKIKALGINGGKKV
jgi:hypothetical protein